MNVEPVSFALTPSMSISTIVARRDAMVAQMKRVREEYLLMQTTHAAIFGDDAEESLRDYDTRLEWGCNHRDLDDEDQMGEAIKRMDAQCWDRLMALSGLMQLMDGKLRAEWREQLEKHQMPEFTLENINATFEILGAQRGDIFERGVENVFRKLSWDYKTNSPRKFGKRQIFTYAAERSHYLDKNTGRFVTSIYGPNHAFADKLDDLVRAFCVLDGKPEPSHDRGAYATLASGAMAHQEVQTGEKLKDAEGVLHGYLRFKGFKNGNAHVTFLRLDLVDELNRIIARRCPNALPPSSEAD